MASMEPLLASLRCMSSARTILSTSLVSFGLVAFAAWVKLLMHIGPVSLAEANQDYTIQRAALDVWYAMAGLAAFDAFVVAFNFNRSLIHQWHYFISLRITAVAAIVGYLFTVENYLLLQTLLMLVLYAFIIVITEWFHTFLPHRSSRTGPGSAKQFHDEIASLEVSWPRAMLYAALTGSVGFAFTLLVPRSLSPLSPVVYLAFEAAFLGRMKTRQTARYIIFATPYIQAAVAYDWGLSQTVQSPFMTLSPHMFVGFVILSRLITDAHLYVFNRNDLWWVRQNMLIRTSSLFIFLAAMLGAEAIGFPFYTFYLKIGFTFFMHAAGVLIFLVPAAHIIVDRLLASPSQDLATVSAS